MTKKPVLILALMAILVLPLLAFCQDTPPNVPAIPTGYETVYLLLSTLFGVLIVPLIQFLKTLSWYPKTNSSWLDWTFQFLFAFITTVILSMIYIKKFELNQIFLVTFIMVIATVVNTARKTIAK